MASSNNTNLERAVRLFTHYMKMVALNKIKLWDSDNEAEIRELVELLMEQPKGIQGSGVCICEQTPEYVQAYAKRLETDFALVNVDLILDHRCPHHGEKAQPAVWGRHKEKKLNVTPKQWLSLGVTRG